MYFLKKNSRCCVSLAIALLATSTLLNAQTTIDVDSKSSLTASAVTPVADTDPPYLSYSYLCYGDGGAGNAWEKTTCYPPGQPIGGKGEANYSTGNDGTDPYNGWLAPDQKLQLTIQCGWEGHVGDVHINKNSHIKCNSSQKQKGTKIYNCHNNSDSSNHSWELKKYQCPEG